MPSVAAPDLVAPAWSWMPDFHDTLGPEVADLCEGVGFTPDAEQRLALDYLFAFQGDGRSAVRDFGLCAPRQNMKTGLLKMAALGWLFVTETRLVIWSAHEFRTSQEAFRDMVNLIEGHPDLDAEVLRTSRGKTGIMRGNGDESIELRGDRRLVFKARTKSGGRGLTGDRVVLDEAMYLRSDMMASLVPTLRARPDPQLVFAGSAGLLESEEWRRLRDRGRGASDRAAAWLEWGDPRAWECADPECDHQFGAVGCGLDDEDRWWATNTALHSGRIDVESLRTDRRMLDPIKFATETLGWWEDPPTGMQDDILRGWHDAITKDPAAGALTLALDVGHDGRGAALSVYGSGVVECVDWRRGSVGWVPERVAELREKHRIGPFGVAAGSPAVALLPQLPDDTTVIPAGVANAACAAFAQRINDGGLWHRSQPVLDNSVAAAVRVFAGDGWRWSRSKSLMDISPLWSAVLAAHLGAVAPPDPDPGVYLI